jgi:hypothetical protein
MCRCTKLVVDLKWATKHCIPGDRTVSNCCCVNLRSYNTQGFAPTISPQMLKDFEHSSPLTAHTSGDAFDYFMMFNQLVRLCSDKVL